MCRFINAHGALLPRYRGMHGGTWAIINGETKAGFTLHEVDEGIDSGPIFFQASIDVEIHHTINEIRENIQKLFEREIIEQIKRIYHNQIIPIVQDNSKAIHVCRRKPCDSKINWNWSSKRIHDFIRALAPPYTLGAFTTFGEQKLYFEKSKYLELPEYYGIPGQIVSIINDNTVLIKTGDTALEVNFSLQNSELKLVNKLTSKVGWKLN